MKIIRCKDCALDGNPECPLSYIEKQTLCFVEHSPLFFCGKAKPTEDYQPTNGDVIRNLTDRQLAEWLTDYKELKNSIGAVKLSNMKEALALIRTLKAELNGWKEDPFGIIAEVCKAVTDCRRCQWYEKCPFLISYDCYPEDWRN